MYKRFYPTFPQGKQKVFTLSYDDGISSDGRLVELMHSHHVRGTFNLNSGYMPEAHREPEEGKTWAYLTAEEAKALYRDGIEVAVHGVTHPFWGDMASSEALRDILQDKEALENLFGGIIRGAAAPYGSIGSRIAALLPECGLEYCRGVACSHDLEVLPRNPRDYYELRGTVRHREPEMQPLAEKFAAGDPGKRLWMLYVWGHTYEFEQKNNWDIMEKLLDTVSEREDVWYATNLEMVDYLKASARLRFNVDGTMVQNPTAADLWFRVRYSGKSCPLYCIKAGQTLHLPEEGKV